jgi:hypothetical protein
MTFCATRIFSIGVGVLLTLGECQRVTNAAPMRDAMLDRMAGAVRFAIVLCNRPAECLARAVRRNFSYRFDGTKYGRYLDVFNRARIEMLQQQVIREYLKI